MPLATLLAGPVGTLPLAPLTDEAAPNLTAVVEQIDERLQKELPPPAANKMRAAMLMLMGLRYSEAIIRPLYERLTSMKESVTYQMIVAEGLAEGRAEGLKQGLEKGLEKGKLAGEKHLLLLQGRKRFGEPDSQTVAALEAIANPEQLDALGKRLLDVSQLARNYRRRQPRKEGWLLALFSSVAHSRIPE